MIDSLYFQSLLEDERFHCDEPNKRLNYMLGDYLVKYDENRE